MHTDLAGLTSAVDEKAFTRFSLLQRAMRTTTLDAESLAWSAFLGDSRRLCLKSFLLSMKAASIALMYLIGRRDQLHGDEVE